MFLDMFSEMFSKGERILITAIVITSLTLMIILSLLCIKIEKIENEISKIDVGQKRIEKLLNN